MGRFAEGFGRLGNTLFEEVVSKGIIEALREVSRSGVKQTGEVLRVHAFGLGKEDEASWEDTLAKFEKLHGPTEVDKLVRYFNGLHKAQNDLFRLIVTKIPTDEGQLNVLEMLADAPDDEARNQILLNVIRERKYLAAVATWLIGRGCGPRATPQEKYDVAVLGLKQNLAETLDAWQVRLEEWEQRSFREQIARKTPETARKALVYLARLPNDDQRTAVAKARGWITKPWSLAASENVATLRQRVQTDTDRRRPRGLGRLIR